MPKQIWERNLCGKGNNKEGKGIETGDNKETNPHRGKGLEKEIEIGDNKESARIN